MEDFFNLSLKGKKFIIKINRDKFKEITDGYKMAKDFANKIFEGADVTSEVVNACVLNMHLIDNILGKGATFEILGDDCNDLFSTLNILCEIKNAAVKFKKERILSYLPERLGY